MHLEIITPEEVLISQDNVTDVKVPGVQGEFQLLDHHALYCFCLTRRKHYF